MNKKCLIALCSKKKAENECIALEMYRGGPWNVIRKNNNKDMDIYVLSAKYGLLKTNTLIQPYDLLMDDIDVEDMKEDKTWAQLNVDDYDNVMISVGGAYLKAIPDRFFNHPKVTFTSARFLKAFSEIKHFMLGTKKEEKK
jgi:hypothetical protein|tara:strand:- start:208 stop:630 length:423 start_codon:yes stop_codon:yes gene_type:complete